ncbi:hypothetical protein GCM10022419_078300 [Nonomuraea rosea]|uniref:CHAT domain-containing protein n=1 Tax=Nonomuraea rosea TaxID=638574 RepID=A0ABP6YKK9_9ACTN
MVLVLWTVKAVVSAGGPCGSLLPVVRRVATAVLPQLVLACCYSGRHEGRPAVAEAIGRWGVTGLQVVTTGFGRLPAFCAAARRFTDRWLTWDSVAGTGWS